MQQHPNVVFLAFVGAHGAFELIVVEQKFVSKQSRPSLCTWGSQVGSSCHLQR
ncbi:hypothetical protein I3843_05G114500 [Carya illinoinensis]|nr:hypothetical protein I3843_05G114500 [Carya illinoinensis]